MRRSLTDRRFTLRVFMSSVAVMVAAMVGATMAATLLGGCGGSSSSPPASPPAASSADAEAPSAAKSAWPQFAARFIEDYFRAQPFFAVQAGKHEFDGQMPDLSADGIAAEVR
jgi:hypothetical protein